MTAESIALLERALLKQGKRLLGRRPVYFPEHLKYKTKIFPQAKAAGNERKK